MVRHRSLVPARRQGYRWCPVPFSRAPTKPVVPKGLKPVALFEAAKGALVLVAGGGVLLFGHDAEGAAEELIRRLHLDPAQGYPHIFLQVAERLTHGRLGPLAAGALCYALVRFAEAYGLWRGRRWAEWVAVAGAAIYLLLGGYELWRRVSWITVGAVAINLAVVAYVGRVLVTGHDRGVGEPSGTPPPAG